MRQARTIQAKMMRVILLTSGIILLLTCIAFFAYEVITYRDITRRELSVLGQVIASQATSSLAFDDREDAAEVLGSLRAQKHVVAACIYDNQGKLYVAYPASLAADALPARPSADGYRFGRSFLEGFEPVVQKGARLGTVYIKSDLKGIYSRFQLYGLIAISFILISFAFAYFFSRRLQRSISRPITHLAQTARMVSEEKDYSVRAEKMSEDETGALTDAFNQMLAQIGSQSDEIRKLNANLEEKVTRRTGELQEAIATLQRQNEFIQAIIDSTVDLIAVFNRRFEFEVVNEKAAEVLDKDLPSMLGQSILKLFPYLAGGTFVGNLERALAGEFVHDKSYRTFVSDRHLEIFFIPLEENGSITRVLVVAHDVTSIVQANERLKQLNTELEKSNRDLEQFAYVASHDLQEPLRKIQLFSELSGKNKAHPEILGRYLDKINTSAARMSELIQAVLNYSRLSRREGELSDVDLARIISGIRNDLELVIEEKKAVIDTGDLPVYRGHALQLHQLFLNLVSNALKFSQQAPLIRIQCRMVDGTVAHSGGKKDESFLEITVADNGIGFDQEYAEQIFAIFQRLHTRNDYPGTGIGLALCKKIVENHGGTIRAESEKGVGTRFFIYLPAEGAVGTRNTEYRTRNVEG